MQKHTRLPQLAIVRIDGGLGSQMWQYALGMAIEKRSGLPVLHDLSWYSYHGKDLLGINSRKFELDSVFRKVHIKPAPQKIIDLFRSSGRVLTAIEPCTEELLSSQEPRFFDGYYRGNWFLSDIMEDILKIYRFDIKLSEENALVYKRIHRSAAPVAVHIRRGDFLVTPTSTVLSAAYFVRALDRMVSMLPEGVEPDFFVFSDTMGWAKAALGQSPSPRKFHYIENNGNGDGCYDMFLMSQCEHFITSASGFSYWAALLSPQKENKIVLCPDEVYQGVKNMKLPGWHKMPIPEDSES